MNDPEFTVWYGSSFKERDLSLTSLDNAQTLDPEEKSQTPEESVHREPIEQTVGPSHALCPKPRNTSLDGSLTSLPPDGLSSLQTAMASTDSSPSHTES